MDDVVAKGVEVVQIAEASLRALMQTAVNEGQYGGVAALAKWAEQLAQIIRNSPAERRDLPVKPGHSTTRRSGRRTLERPKRGKSKYPIFRRIGDALVKIAWSKASKSEYQHQAPKEVVVALFRKMQTLGHGEELIAMDAVLPLVMEDGQEVPAYQIYVCLAWLRATGAVKQYGRKGYSLDVRSNPTDVIQQRWSELPVHRS